MTAEILIFNVTKDMVMNGDLADYHLTLTRDDMFGKAHFSFHGWDEDPREIYDIPEIVDWINKFYARVPHVLFFLGNMIQFNVAVFLLCLCAKHTKITTLKNGRQMLDPAVLTKTAHEMLENGIEYAKRRKSPFFHHKVMRKRITEVVGL